MSKVLDVFAGVTSHDSLGVNVFMVLEGWINSGVLDCCTVKRIVVRNQIVHEISSCQFIYG